jgi:hypothetical protein
MMNVNSEIYMKGLNLGCGAIINKLLISGTSRVDNHYLFFIEVSEKYFKIQRCCLRSVGQIIIDVNSRIDDLLLMMNYHN